MKKITSALVIFTFTFLFCSCGQQKSSDKDTSVALTENKICVSGLEKIKKELINKDIEFSNYSEKNGMNEAFINYIADNGVILRPNSKPIVGKDTVTALFNKNKKKKSNVQLTWTPLFADVAVSGELGYTYGTYVATITNGKTEPGYGTYVTIWKKDKKGDWKFVLDTGNEGLTPPKK